MNLKYCDGKKPKELCRCGRLIKWKYAFCPVCKIKQERKNKRLLESKRLKVSDAMLHD